MSIGGRRRIKQLRSNRAEVRAAAVCAVAEHGETSAIPILGELLHDEERALRVAAAQALGSLKHPSGVGPLIDALVSENSWDVRYEIAEALRKIGDPGAINKLVVILEGDREEGAREFAAWALKEFGWDKLKPSQQAAVAVMQDDWVAVRKLGADATEAVCQALNSGTPHVRRYAAEALAAIANDRAVAALVAGLDSEVADLRHTCASVLEKQVWTNLEPKHLARVAVILHKWAIAISAGPAAVVPLMDAFRGSDPGTQRQIVDVLRSIGGREATAALVESAKSVDPDVRKDAVDSLAGTVEPDATEVLVRALSDDDTGVRKGAALGLKQLGWEPPDDATRVQLAIASGDAKSLTDLGDVALPGLIASLRTPAARSSAMKLIGEFGPAAIDPLVELLDEKATDLRVCAINTLATLGDGAATSKLMPLLRDPAAEVRHAVATALPQLGWQPTDAGQSAVVALACEDWDAVHACGPAAVVPLLECTKDKSQREAALNALERLLHGESVNRLVAVQLNAIIEAVEAIARPVSTRRIASGMLLKQAVVCRRIAQVARGALQRSAATKS